MAPVRDLLRVSWGIIPVRGQHSLVLLDAAGRKAMDLVSGDNDVSRVEPGVYFVRAGGETRKVVIAR